ncbi:hypothetical protein, partial [Klebsiella grimontii]
MPSIPTSYRTRTRVRRSSHVSQPVLIADTFSSLVWKVSLPDGT